MMSKRAIAMKSVVGSMTLITRCKILSVMAVTVAITYHGTVQRHRGVPTTSAANSADAADESCHSLLTNGSFISKDVWQPHGCVQHNYSTQETEQCLRTAAATTGEYTHIAMAGDSRLRWIYNGLFRQLGVNMEITKELQYSEANFTFLYTRDDIKLRMDYYFRPVFNEDAVDNVMAEFKRQPPNFIVGGAVLHFIVNYHSKSRTDGLKAYVSGLKRFVKELDALPTSTAVIYKMTEPWNEEKLPRQHQDQKNEDIPFYNDAATKVFNGTRVKLWESARLIGTERQWDYYDGSHAANATVDYFVQTLINFVCNRHMAASLPVNSCCTIKSKSPSLLSQDGSINSPSSTVVVAGSLESRDPAAIVIVVFVVLIAWICNKRILQMFSWLFGESPGSRVQTTAQECLEDQHHLDSKGRIDAQRSDEKGSLLASPPRYEESNSPFDHLPLLVEKESRPDEAPSDRQNLWSLFKLSLILGYFLLCDSLNFFVKSSKEFTLFHFAAPLTLAAAAASFSIKTRGAGSRVEQILPREITDEWKGWMQSLLLVYHTSGASRNLSIYMHVRVIVSAYLFLTGYGHFSRYWKTGNAGGFERYCQVMYRLNFLTVLLCLVMDQPYMNYYFVVLVSFWYTVLHVVLALPPHLTESGLERTSTDFVRGTLKITIVALIVAVLSYFTVFESVFGLRYLSKVFQLQGNPGEQEWRFRWTLDKLSVLYGMIFALVCQGWTRFWPSDSIGSRWPSTKWGTALLAALSLSSFVCYPFLLQTCNTKRACNHLHPYFTWIPILGYIFFRHHSSLFRTHFSALFAFLGRISLELFISQYHILLASNTHSLLVLVPGQPIINTVVTGLVFLCSAHEISNITGDLQPTLAPSDVKKMTRNLLFVGFGILLFVCWNSIG